MRAPVTVLFPVLDAYYLGLEKGLRTSYNSFIDELHEHKLKPSDLYVVEKTSAERIAMPAAKAG